MALVATKDTEKAQKAIDEGIKDEGGSIKERSYEGVDYQVDKDGVAAGIVGDFFTVGTEPEFKRTVKANDGDSLADDKKYKDTVGKIDDDRLGLFYIDLKPFFEQAIKADPSAAQSFQQLALGVPGRQARAAGRRAAGRRRPDRVRHGHERPGRGRAARRSPPSSAPARRRWWPSCPATRGPRTGRRTSARG